MVVCVHWIVLCVLSILSVHSLKFLSTGNEGMNVDGGITTSSLTVGGQDYQAHIADFQSHINNHPRPSIRSISEPILWATEKIKHVNGPKSLTYSFVTGTEYDPSNFPKGVYMPTFVKKGEEEIVMIGGQFTTHVVNQVWNFNTTSSLWKFVRGTLPGNGLPNFGTQGEYSSSTQVGGISQHASWPINENEVYVGLGEQYTSSTFHAQTNLLWCYHMYNNEWKFVYGDDALRPRPVYGLTGVYSNETRVPGMGRATTWVRGTELFLFGGRAMYHSVNAAWPGDWRNVDYMWSFDTSKVPFGQWRFVRGTKDTSNVLPQYGTKGVYSSANTPGSIQTMLAFDISDDEVLLFSGDGGSASIPYVDVWHYSMSLNEFKHVKGPGVAGVEYTVSIFGTQGEYDDNNIPAALSRPSGAKIDENRFVVIGGYGYDMLATKGSLDNIWEYNMITNQWKFVRGSKVKDAAAVFGTTGEYSASNKQWYGYGGVALTVNKEVYMFGGANSYAADVFVLELKSESILKGGETKIFEKVHREVDGLYIVKVSLTVSMINETYVNDLNNLIVRLNSGNVGKYSKTLAYGDVETISYFNIFELKFNDVIEVFLSSLGARTEILQNEEFSLKIINI